MQKDQTPTARDGDLAEGDEDGSTRDKESGATRDAFRGGPGRWKQ